MIYLWSTIAGLLIGIAVSAGAARMFKAPDVQGLGAFRTLGEINACKGDSISHFSYGLGFFLNSAAAAAGTGALTQDVAHRVIPNWAAAILTFRKKREKMKLLENPFRMALAGGFVGMLVVPILVGANQIIPSELSNTAKAILKPSADWLFKYIMPSLFLLAAINSGKQQAIYAILFGVISQFVSGNALPGIILGIIMGSVAKSIGHKNWKTITMIIFVTCMFILIFYFRNMDQATGLLKKGTFDSWLKLKVIN